MSFVHLHTHSHYSILEWLPKPADYVKKAKELGMNALALTDTGNIHGCHEFYKACMSEWIKPILWAEVFIKSEFEDTLNHKLVLLATSLSGYKNIIQIISKGSLDNPGTTPTISLEDMIGQTSDVICLSGPASSEIAYYILSWKSDEEIVLRIKKYQEIFGEDSYFLELLYHEDIPKQKFITQKLIELHKKYEIPVVAANDCYYVDKDDKNTQDVIMALGKWYEIENPDRPTLIHGDYSLLSLQEMEALFGDIPSALENTQKIADKVDIHIPMWGILIPRFSLPEADYEIYQRAQKYQKKQSNTAYQILSSDEWYLRYLSFHWLNWRYGTDISEEKIFELIQKLDKPWLETKLTETSPEELRKLSLTYYSPEKKKLLAELPEKIQDRIQRLEYELIVVHEMWFDGYFLIVADYIGRARRKKIPVGPGRGSAAGSLMAYLTGITDLDPIDYGLLFERFLNPARISMPDIDTDFSDEWRDRVVDYCRSKYGEDHVAQICTFGTFAARAAVKDVWRVMGIPFGEMNELGKLIPSKPWTKIADALTQSPEFIQAYNEKPIYKKIIDTALKIEWNVRHVWVHACAVIIAPQPMTHFTALAHPPKDAEVIVTQYSAYPLEDLWLLKMDFLWLRNLTIIQRTQKIIEAAKQKNVDISDIPLDDSQVFDIFAAGDTTWVFQFESEWMRKYLKDLSPDRFEDIIAMVSLYRPGPMAYIPSYVERKHGREEIEYLLPALREILEKKKYSNEEILAEKQKLEEDLQPILDVTYGIAVYQEQLMFIVQYMAGFSLGEADLLRRWVGKKIATVIAELKKEFVTKAESYRGYKPETSTFIYEEMIQPAANYSFNKSHAACYALIAYQTAYLKAHYRTEFLTSMMTSDEENTERIMLEVAEAQENGIDIIHPDINESLKHFTYIDDTHIRFWLKAIKWLWDGPIDAILQARSEKKFEDIHDFITRAGKEALNKKALEALVLAGAMDMFGERAALLASIDDMVIASRYIEKQQSSSQIWLFEHMGEEFDEGFELQEVPGMSYEKKLFWEKEVLGYMVSGHPLDGLQNYCQRRSRWISYIKKSFEQLEILAKKDEKKFKQQLEKQQLSAIGVIVDTRKIITKNGKNMMFLYCEGYDYDFEVTLFEREYLQYKDDIEIGKIIIAEGTLGVNFDYKRKTIRARKLTLINLTTVREQARSMGMFNNKKRTLLWLHVEEVQTWDEKFELQLEKKIRQHKSPKPSLIMNNTPLEKYTIPIPTGTQLEKIHELKDFLQEQPVWQTHVYIYLSGKEVYTKFAIQDIGSLESWIEQKL